MTIRVGEKATGRKTFYFGYRLENESASVGFFKDFSRIERIYRMLCLSRKPGERVLLGSNVWVTVVGISGDKVRLAFDAPDGVPVNREEVAKAIARSGRVLPALVPQHLASV